MPRMRWQPSAMRLECEGLLLADPCLQIVIVVRPHSVFMSVSAGTNQGSENDRSAARVARVQPGQERSLRKTSHAVAGFFDECSRSDPLRHRRRSCAHHAYPCRMRAHFTSSSSFGTARLHTRLHPRRDFAAYPRGRAGRQSHRRQLNPPGVCSAVGLIYKLKIRHIKIPCVFNTTGIKGEST